MGLHGRSSSIASCLWHVLLPVAYHFLFAVNPLWCSCQSTSCIVDPDFSYPISMFPVLLLVILSCSSTSHDWTTVIFVSSLWMCIVSGADDYQSDHSVQMADHVVNGNVYDDIADDYYAPAHHMATANVQTTPQKRRGYCYCLPFIHCHCHH